jgi:carbon monoxide dehydrogenase subunit G
MIHFEGQEEFPAPLAVVYIHLADAGWLAQSLPDTTVTEATPNASAWKVRPKLAFLAGELETTCRFEERQPNERIVYLVETKGVGSASTVRATLHLSSSSTGTHVTWQADVVTMTGLLKLAPTGLIQGAAKKVIADCWAAIQARMAAAG